VSNGLLQTSSGSLFVISYIQSSQIDVTVPFSESRVVLESAPQSLQRPSRFSPPAAAASLVIRSG
jgi:hypothetical protein